MTRYSDQIVNQVDDNKTQQQIQQLTDKYQKVIQLLTQILQTPGGDIEAVKTESDLFEALFLVKQTVHDRLSTESGPDEWKNDYKQNYQALFNSIQEEARSCVRANFSSPNRLGIGYVVDKFNEIVIETFIDILKLVGPSKAKQTIDLLVCDGQKAIYDITQRNYDETDLQIAKQILQKYSDKHQRKNVRQPTSKRQRYHLIANAVERVQNGVE